MSPRLLTALAAGALGLAGCAHDSATDRTSEQARAAAGPNTGGQSDPNAANQAASIRPQASPRTAVPPSMSGAAAGQQAPATDPPTEEPASSDPTAPAAPASPK